MVLVFFDLKTTANLQAEKIFYFTQGAFHAKQRKRKGAFHAKLSLSANYSPSSSFSFSF